MDVNTINEMAMEALDNRDFLRSQGLLRLNAKKNPCFKTNHNLGAYYINCGMERVDGTIYSANKLGKRYLLKANRYNCGSSENERAIGTVYCLERDYMNAVLCFEKALKIENSIVAEYNIAAIYYKLREYKKAAEYCEAINVDGFDNYEGNIEIRIVYAFSLIHYDKANAKRELEHIMKCKNVELEQFVLAYQCGEYQLASQLSDVLSENWKLEVPIIAMIIDCCLSIGETQKAELLFREQMEILGEYNYDTNSELRRIDKVYRSEKYRRKTIERYEHILPIKWDVCFVR